MRLNIEKISKLIKEFDEEFDTKMSKRIKNMPVIMSIYEQFYDEIFKCDENYKKVEDLQHKILTKINPNLEQKELLEKWQDCENILLNDAVERAFICGICINKELNTEILKFNNDIE